MAEESNPKGWNCRLCLSPGKYNIFVDMLTLPAARRGRDPQRIISNNIQGRSQLNHDGEDGWKELTSKATSLLIVEALNYFSEFKISHRVGRERPEPWMICEQCMEELRHCWHFRSKLGEAVKRFQGSEEAGHQTVGEDDLCRPSTGLTAAMEDIEPFLAEATEEECPLSTKRLSASSIRVFHARPRFQLTNQVSSILRHVAVSEPIPPLDGITNNKRKENSTLETSTPKKLQRRRHSADHQLLLDRTLVVVPSYLSLDTSESRKPKMTSEEKTSKESTGALYSCKYCPRTFRAPVHRLNHTRNVHRTEHNARTFPPALAKVASNKYTKDGNRNNSTVQQLNPTVHSPVSSPDKVTKL